MGIPFECDVCHFRNLNHREPVWDNKRDVYTLMCIRRASLDAFWSREASTVSGNLNRLRLDLHLGGRLLSVRYVLPRMGSDTLEDRVGMGLAVYTLQASLRVGRYTNHLQWDSMRKTPTWYSNAFEAGEGFMGGSVYAKDEKKLYTTQCPSASRWFGRFMLGAKRRMGIIRRQNEALTVPQLLALLALAEEDWQKSKIEVERKEIEELCCFCVIGFCLSFRGEEVPLTVIEGLIRFWEETRNHQTPHIMVTLRGRFKGEQNLRWHCVPLADVTRSGIPTRKWVSRLLARRVHKEGKQAGFLFSREGGSRANLGDYDPLFRDYLERVRDKFPKLISQVVEVTDYSLRRSLRRGSTTEAENNKVDPITIELVNRWRKKEKARGSEPGLPMRQVYTQVSRALEASLRYSQSF